MLQELITIGQTTPFNIFIVNRLDIELDLGLYSSGALLYFSILFSQIEGQDPQYSNKLHCQFKVLDQQFKVLDQQ